MENRQCCFCCFNPCSGTNPALPCSGTLLVLCPALGQETRPEPRPYCQKHHGRCASHPLKWLETAPGELWGGFWGISWGFIKYSLIRESSWIFSWQLESAGGWKQETTKPRKASDIQLLKLLTNQEDGQRHTSSWSWPPFHRPILLLHPYLCLNHCRTLGSSMEVRKCCVAY